MARATSADTAELIRSLETCCQALEACLDGGPNELAQAADALEALGGPAWRQLLVALPPGVDQIASTLKPPLQVIIALLQVIKGLLQILVAILLALPDPFRALIQAAHDLLVDIINDLLASGAYVYFDAPGLNSPAISAAELGIPIDAPADFRHGREQDRGPPLAVDQYERWAVRFRHSLDDPGDRERPIVTAGAPIQAVFIIGAAPSLMALRQVIYLLGKLLDLRSFENVFDTPQSDDPRRSRAWQDPVAPDWKAFRLVDLFPILKKLLIIPEALQALLQAVDNIVEQLQNLAQAIQEKIAVLEELAEAVQAIIDLLDALKSTGLYVLPVATTNGIDGVVQGLLTAKDRPPGGYFGGVCFLASGPNLAKAQILFEMFGLGGGDFEDSALGQALGSTVELFEDAKDKAVAEGEALGSSVEQSAEALSEAIANLDPAALASLGFTPEELEAMVEGARATLVEIIDQAKETWPPDAAMDDAVRDTQQAARPGHRSLAIGLGLPLKNPPSEEEEP